VRPVGSQGAPVRAPICSVVRAVAGLGRGLAWLASWLRYGRADLVGRVFLRKRQAMTVGTEDLQQRLVVLRGADAAAVDVVDVQPAVAFGP
jgi:hypothetical protein